MAQADNVLAGFPNRTGQATLSAGSWVTDLPINNIKTRHLHEVARSTDAATASTKFRADFGAAKNFRLIGIHNHNLSEAALWKVDLGTTAGGTDVYTSGWINFWHLTFDNFTDRGTWNGVDAHEYTGSPYAGILTLPEVKSAQHLSISFDDTTNTDGYVQFGRLFAGPAFQPVINSGYGQPVRWNDLSTKQRSESGESYGVARRAYRSAEVVLGRLSHAEAMQVFSLQRQARKVNEVLLVLYPDDPEMNQHYSFLGTMRELNAIEYPFFQNNTVVFSLEELL